MRAHSNHTQQAALESLFACVPLSECGNITGLQLKSLIEAIEHSQRESLPKQWSHSTMLAAITTKEELNSTFRHSQAIGSEICCFKK